MQTKTLAIAAALTFALSGAAMAQTPAGGGSTEGNMNNPGSVKSNSEKSMESSTGSATGGSAGSTGTGMAPAATWARAPVRVLVVQAAPPAVADRPMTV